MGTRGIFGFYAKQEGTKAIYFGHDCYPEGLGFDTIKFIRRTGYKKLCQVYKNLTMLNNDAPETPEIEEMANNVNHSLFALLEGSIIHYDAEAFFDDTLFCEWGYIINLDEKVLEVYSNTAGYTGKPSRYPSNLLMIISLEELKKSNEADWVKVILKEVKD